MRSRFVRTRLETWRLCAVWLASVGACAPKQPATSIGKQEFSIEKPAIILRGSSPAPTYPAELLATRDTGTVHIRVTVNARGRADMRSVVVVSSPHPAFTRAVLDVLPRYQFLPAEVGGGPGRDCVETSGNVRFCKPGRPGKKVPMPVDIPFRFALPAEIPTAPPPA